MSSSSKPHFQHPTPYQIRSLVLDYLCHNCYSTTARAFAQDSTIRHLDADGDEILTPAKGDDSESADLPESVLKSVELRREIQEHILSGRINDAIEHINTHFPGVLTVPGHPEPPRPSGMHMDYVASPSIAPAHLLINLRIAAFIEACRTVPLDYPPRRSEHDADPSLSKKGTIEPNEDDDSNADSLEQQTALLKSAQKLYALATMLPQKSDQDIYTKELGNISGLLAYKVPEESSMAKYLSQERREAVADQVNRAIIYRTGAAAIPALELYARDTAVVWSFLHDLHIKPHPDGPIPPTSGTKTATSSVKGTPSDQEPQDIAPLFDLQQFLDSKA